MALIFCISAAVERPFFLCQPFNEKAGSSIKRVVAQIDSYKIEESLNVKKFLNLYLHIGLSIVNFGLGYFLAEGFLSIRNESNSFEYYFWMLFLLALIPVGVL